MAGLNSLNFAGKSVLVTGATDGIGYGIATAFLSNGAKVTITGTRTADSYSANFSGMNFVRLDCTEPESVMGLQQAVDSLDVLVNCVGSVLYGSQEYERDSFARILDINLTGVMHICTTMSEKLSQSGGCVINIDSCVARIPARNNPAYSASKAALVQLTAVLALKWGKRGIRVNGIGPGLVPTRLTANQGIQKDEDRLCRALPAGRLGTPEDIAGVALFLASPLASYITGQSLVVDGGLTLVGIL